ncbi:MarR family transcriptional regulator [Rhodococcus sp. WS4]|nr:MarR family transcriptional regulator [Rhodococcus sp. WS4]
MSSTFAEPAVPNQFSSGATEGSTTTALIAAVLQAQKLIMRNLNATLSPLGLSFPRYEVLMVVEAAPNGAIPSVLLGRILDRHPTTITSLVDGLESAGLVARATNRDDRRETLVSVTDRGRAAALSAARAVDDATNVDHEVLRRLSVDLQTLLVTSSPGPSTGRNAL